MYVCRIYPPKTGHNLFVFCSRLAVFLSHIFSALALGLGFNLNGRCWLAATGAVLPYNILFGFDGLWLVALELETVVIGTSVLGCGAPGLGSGLWLGLGLRLKLEFGLGLELDPIRIDYYIYL